MFVFHGLSKRERFNRKNNKLDSSGYSKFINRMKSGRRGVNIDPMGRKYFFRSNESVEDDIPVTQSQKLVPIALSPEPKKIYISPPKDNSAQLNRIKSYLQLKNSTNDLSNKILKEQQKINNMELNEIYRIQRHNQIMGELLRENLRKKQILNDLRKESQKEDFNKTSKEFHYIYYPRTIYKNNNNNQKLDEIRNENKKLNENLEKMKINNFNSFNSLKKNLNKAMEDNQKIYDDKHKLQVEINNLRDELYKKEEDKYVISLPHIRTKSLPNFYFENEEKEEKEKEKEDIEYDDGDWVKKILKRNNYILKRCCEMNDRDEYFRCYGG